MSKDCYAPGYPCRRIRLQNSMSVSALRSKAVQEVNLSRAEWKGFGLSICVCGVAIIRDGEPIALIPWSNINHLE